MPNCPRTSASRKPIWGPVMPEVKMAARRCERRRQAVLSGQESRGLVRRIPYPSRRQFQRERGRGGHAARPQRRRQDHDAEVGDGHHRQADRLDPLQRSGHLARLVGPDRADGRCVLSGGARHFRQPRRARKPAAAAGRAQRRPVARPDLRAVSEPEGAARTARAPSCRAASSRCWRSRASCAPARAS